MKRTRRWLLMLSAVVGLMAHTGALRPPSLRLKSTTTASTTTTTTEALPSSTTETVQETQSEETLIANTTGKTLTGIPQIDYIWDPNLPRELNGYNLSEYPFLSTIPEKIEFKCGDLHDGFYASTKYKCQIYHHCIYGIRHDFLCANYTAFDQRTFICHFVSEVDCKNSDKYFFRNDALYKATTTSTTSTTTTTTVAPPPGKRRRPFRRRRPVDYYYDEEYDDYFEERMNRRQKNRPRPRRPEYDDEYEEDVYEKRPHNRERKRGGSSDDSNYDRRPAERPVDRSAERPVERPAERPAERPLDRPRHRARPSDSRRYNDEEEEDRYTPPRKSGKRRKPIDDFEDDDKEVVSSGARRFSSNDRRPSNPKVADEELEEVRRPLAGRKRKGGRRPLPEDEEDDIIDRPSQRSQIDDEPPPKERKEETIETVPVVRTSGPGSIFKSPRKPPRIAPPVPITERKKFEFSAAKKSATTSAPRFDDEYYDDYEDDVRPAKKAPKKEEKYAGSGSLRDRDLEPEYEEDIRPVKQAPKKENKYPEGGSTRDRDRDRVRDRDRNYKRPVEVDSPVAVREDPKTRYETVESSADLDDYEDVSVKSSRYRPNLERGSFRHAGGRDEGYEKVQKRKPVTDSAPLKPIKNYNDAIPEPEFEPEIQPKHSYVHDDEPKPETSGKNPENPRPIVRVIKRPFLPSRGGSPYLPRGLQVVGAAQKPLPTESTPIDMGSTVSGVRLLEHGPPILRANTDPDDYPPQRKGPRTTQQPQIDQERAALEKLYESEYDVTLNDALNPTLKPVVRGVPSGFTNPQTFGNGFASLDSSPYTYQDSLYSSTDSRRRSVQPSAAAARSSQLRQEPAFYDYDY